MNPQRVNLFAWLVVAIGTVAAPALLYTGFFVKLDSAPASQATTPVKQGDVSAAAPSQVPSLQSFEPAVSKSLRGGPMRAGDVPQTVATNTQPAVVPVTSARLQLVGTVGTSVALIKGPDGTVAMAVVGDEVDGAVVVAIRASQVDLRQNGRPMLLQKPVVASPDAAGVIIR